MSTRLKNLILFLFLFIATTIVKDWYLIAFVSVGMITVALWDIAYEVKKDGRDES